ncbi:MAG: transposase, partial [Megasphaera sp.]|nr:transposase [Megasphaera sp.]
MSDLTKTIKPRIHVSPEQEILFRQMTEHYRQACNFVSQYIFDNQFNLAYQSLNKELYCELRVLFGLKSQLAQSSIKTTMARYKTVKQQLFQKPYKYKDQDGSWKYITKTLEWLWKPIFFKRPQADLVRNRDYSFVDHGQSLSINTLGKRTRCTFEGKHFAEYLDGSWNLGTAKLVELKGLWYLHIPVTKAVEGFQKGNVRHVVGIDRGLLFLTVSYDDQGKTEFVSGRKIAAKRHKFLKIRQQLQSKGTKSAKRRLKALSGRENRWMSDVNHRISKTLVTK